MSPGQAGSRTRPGDFGKQMIYYLLGSILLLMVVFLAAPLSLGYHSAEKWFKVKWLGLTITRRWGRDKPEKLRRKMARKSGKSKGLAILVRLWQQRELGTALIPRLGHFVLEVARTSSFRDSAATISLPDPMVNGVLFGFLTNVPLKNLDLSVNFENRNFARIWVTVHPHRVARPLAVLLLHLPYRQMLRFAWDLKHLRGEV